MVGPYPPPAGGASSHVRRAVRLLQREGLRVRVLTHGTARNGSEVVGALRRNPVRYWLALRRNRSNIVHYHHSRIDTLLAVALAARRDRAGRYLLTVHGQVLDPWLEMRAPLVPRLTRWAIEQFDSV